MNTNGKRKCNDDSEHECPPTKKQKLNTTVVQFDALDIKSTEKKHGVDPIGEIIFDICSGPVLKLASFEAKWDSEYKRIDFEDVDGDYFDDTNSDDSTPWITQFFKLHHSEIDATEFIQQIFFKLIKYIFDYENISFSTIVFTFDFIQKYKIEFRDSYHNPYCIENKYYFLRVTKPNLLFNHNKINTNECNMFIKNEDHKFITNKIYSKQTIKNTMKLQQKLWNDIDGILDTIMNYIPNYLEFERKCIILKNCDDDKRIQIHFDFPIILIGKFICDIPFKLRINNVDITGSRFFDNSYSDRRFRLNKYSYSNNIDWFYIDRNHTIKVYYCLETRNQHYDDIYGYTTFEDQIANSGLQITDVEECNLNTWDDEMIEALKKLKANE